MKKTFCLFLMVFTCVCISAQKQCTTCRGSGKRYIPGVSGFGTRDTKKICPTCTQSYYPTSGHWCICTTCKGAKVISGRDIHSGHRDNSGSEEVYSYLTPAEASALQNLLQLRMKGTKYQQVPCRQCNASGICQGCRGTGYIFGSQPCPGCYMMRSCGVCMGSKVVSQEIPLSEAELQQLEKNIKYFFDIAQSRMK